MFTAIITWTGAMLGITVLLLMAFGPVVIDFEFGRARRLRRAQRKQAAPPG